MKNLCEHTADEILDAPVPDTITTVIADDLARSGLFAEVRTDLGGGRWDPDLVVEGSIVHFEAGAELAWYDYILWNAPPLISPFVWLGIAGGRFSHNLAIDLQLKRPEGGDALWQYRVYSVGMSGRRSVYSCGLAWWDDCYEELNQTLKKQMAQAMTDMKSRSAPVLAALSQSAPKAQVRKETPSVAIAAPLSVRNVHVLVIGIKDYEDATIPPLKYSGLDAKAVYEFFRSSPRSPARPENVHFLGDEPNEDGLKADKLGVLQGISRYLIEKANDERDMALLYFSGHGDAGKHPLKNAGYYLIPKDAQRTDLYNTAIELGELQRRWDAVRARTKVLVADACNAGGFSGMKNLRVRGVETVEGASTVVMTSARGDERSLESDGAKRGLFTNALLEGLAGKADALSGDGDGRVSVQELKLWLEKVVPQRAAEMGGKQTPAVKMPDGWGGVYLTR